jgi:flavin reductase (DIM6/NTAB) family NADH-FMN oxidoreductase RutF
MAATVDRLARTTGSDPLPPHKVAMGYRHVRDKFGCAGLHAEPSVDVAPPRVRECPVQLEARLASSHRVAEHIESDRDRLIALEVTIVRVHVDESLLVEGEADRIDPDRWRPLIMSFCQFYGLSPRLRHSTLAEIPESIYRPASRKNDSRHTGTAG